MVQLALVFFFIRSDFSPRSAFLLALQPILVLYIPLVLVAWQYSQRAVFLFCGLTFLADTILTSILVHVSSLTTASPLFGMAFIRTVLFLLVGNMIANLMQVQREQRRRLTEANDRLAQYAAALEQLTISRERNRMARELHDVMAHTMSGVAVELEGVRAMLRVDPDQAENLLGHSLSAVREGLTETRRSLQALRASPLEDLGLGLAVRSLAESIAGRASLQTVLQIENDLGDLPAEVQQCFYRVAQEALSNIAAHAQARSVQVCLGREGPALELSITDDGSGFDLNTIDLTQKYGLLGMRERVEMIQGDLSIASQAGSGTRIVLTYGGGG
jgi:signal transduction histidine kinase